jgi:predicted molibdopterin-dependent oxidoreductase YjgC
VHEIASSPDRLLAPQIRKNGKLEEVSWDEALGYIAARLADIRQRCGPDALAFLNSPRCSNEEAYLLQKLARAVIGTNNVDHGTGVYSNNALPVLLEMIGVPATTSSIAELKRSEVIVLDAVDVAKRMPTVGGAILRAKLGGAKLIVIGTRRHRLVANADIFLQIKPGTEPFLNGAMAKVIVDHGLMNLDFVRSRCHGYEDFVARLRDYDLLHAAETCGVPAELIEAAAVMYARASAAALLYSASMEARSAESVQGLVNLVLLTGNLGKPGAGLFALAEQNNLQGVCDMGVLPDRLPGYQPVADTAARVPLEKAWNCGLPTSPGLSARSVLTDLGQGKVKGLWLDRYDPVSTSFLAEVSQTLRKCELVVQQHLFPNETMEFAHVVLPTPAYGEERVSFTSTERRIQLAEQVVDSPAGPRPAWEQLTEVARRLGANWNYPSAADVMAEISEVVDFYSGVSYENLAREYGRQWPCTKDKPLGSPILFAGNGAPTDGEAAVSRPFKFVPVPRPPDPEALPKDFPLILVFGNSLYYWNHSVLARHSETLRREYGILDLDYPRGFVEMHPEDAKRLGVRDGERICLRAAAASAAATARVTPEVRSGTIFVPHFVRDVAQQILGSAEYGSLLVPVRVEREAAQ